MGVILVVLVVWAISMVEHKRLLASTEWYSSTIDWCEENHAVTTVMAEFWNTVSSVSMIIAACS